MSRPVTRRDVLHLATSLAACRVLRAQTPSIAHANVAELDRGAILAQAKLALAVPVRPPRSPAFHTETEPTLATAGASPGPQLQRADAEALGTFSGNVAALAAGLLLTHDDAYAQRAVAHCRAWLLDPKTRLQPSFDGAGCAPGTNTGTPMGVVDLVPLAELARALSFMTGRFSQEELAEVQAWFAAAQQWMANSKQAFVAQEAKDHRASAWLLVSTGMARFVRDDNVLEENRKRFRQHTLRDQIRPDGVFPAEVATPNPYRNTLFNFDLLAGTCQLLSSPFDDLWDYQLLDEVGIRSAAAYLFPVISHPEKWPFPADARYFRDLPGRRAGMLFAGRAFSRPEYVQTWLDTPPVAPPVELAYSFPIQQPALWTARAPHGL